MRLAELARDIGLERRSGDVEFEGISTNSRTLATGELFVALKGERFDGHDFVPKIIARGAAGAVVSQWRDVSLPQLLCPDTEMALGQIAAVWRRRCAARLVGVTGSNGKTTVKTMLHAILSQAGPCLANTGNLNNEIGLPLTLCRLGPEHQYAVVEMGAGQVGDIRYLANLARPEVGVITNAGPAHLERMGSIESVARVKGELFESLPSDGTLVINADDAFADYWHGLADGRQVIRFGLDNEAEFGGRHQPLNDHASLAMDSPLGSAEIRLPVTGRHNALNALAAAAAAHAVGADLDQIVSGLENFEPEDGRLQASERDGWTLIQDTYNANPASLRAGIEAMLQRSGQHWLVLGDMAELGDQAAELHRQAGAEARKLGVVRLLCVGDLAAHAVTGFGDGGEHFGCKSDLVQRFAELIEPGVVCLVKGSRSMRMEEVAEPLSRLVPGGAACC
jgi:UDP-N-acetylmuramoyl-tripeptide--D-alanyl-D-alanine ligase